MIEWQNNRQNDRMTATNDRMTALQWQQSNRQKNGNNRYHRDFRMTEITETPEQQSWHRRQRLQDDRDDESNRWQNFWSIAMMKATDDRIKQMTKMTEWQKWTTEWQRWQMTTFKQVFSLRPDCTLVESMAWSLSSFPSGPLPAYISFSAKETAKIADPSTCFGSSTRFNCPTAVGVADPTADMTIASRIQLPNGISH